MSVLVSYFCKVKNLKIEIWKFENLIDKWKFDIALLFLYSDISEFNMTSIIKKWSKYLKVKTKFKFDNQDTTKTVDDFEQLWDFAHRNEITFTVNFVKSKIYLFCRHLFVESSYGNMSGAFINFEQISHICIHCQCRIQMYFGTVWMVWAPKKVLVTLFPLHFM